MVLTSYRIKRYAGLLFKDEEKLVSFSSNGIDLVSSIYDKRHKT